MAESIGGVWRVIMKMEREDSLESENRKKEIRAGTI